MASIKKRGKRGNSYTITVTDGSTADGKKKQTHTTWTAPPGLTEKQAKKALDDFARDFEKKVKSGKYLDGERMTFNEFLAIWKTEYADKQLADTTRQDNIFALESKAAPLIGKKKLAEIRPLDIQAIYSKMEKDGYIRYGKQCHYASATYKRLHAVIVGTFNIAIGWDLLETNPALKAKPPKCETADKVKFFSIAETQTFLNMLEADEVPTQMKVFYHLALFAGTRNGETCALRWEDVDFAENTVSINKSTCYSKELKQHDKLPKNKTSNRTIALPPSVMLLLKRHKLEQQTKRIGLGSAWVGENHLFTQTTKNIGKQISLTWPSQYFKKLIDRHNAEHSENKLPQITLHGLRHTSATLQLSQNIDIKTVSKRLGHSLTSTTMNIYAHALEELDRSAAEALETVTKRKQA